jgi:hypothetical protein
VLPIMMFSSGLKEAFFEGYAINLAPLNPLPK